jgi:molybdopterin molybdotransferase
MTQSNITQSTDACFRPNLLSVEEAQGFLLENARRLDEVRAVETAESLGCVLAAAQVSSIDVPGYDNSAMDGYAVRSEDAAPSGMTKLAISQRIAAGREGSILKRGQAARIFTGAPMPPGADAVVMQERCREEGDLVCFEGPVRLGENVRLRGNDIARGTEVLSAGTRIRAQEMGLAASVGLATLPVFRRLRIAILSTGDELVVPGKPLGPDKIYNSNRYILFGLLTRLGCEVSDGGTVADDLAATEQALQRAAQGADVIVASGGVSVGEEDYLKEAVSRLGRLDLWRIAVKPGKPLAYGRVQEADFLGLPGNPVSVLVTFCLFVRPFLLRRQGTRGVMPRSFRVKSGFSWPKPGLRREYLRARLVQGEDGDWRAEAFPRQGSDVLTSAVWADGLVEVPEGKRFSEGDDVSFLPFSELLG